MKHAERTRLPSILSLVLALALLTSSVAHALPTTMKVSANDDDVTIQLWVLDTTIDGDSKSYCRLSFVDAGSDVKLKAGDKVSLKVYEDDTLGDDLIWEKNFTVSAAQAAAGSINETYDCSAKFPDDVGDNAEYYAEASVDKDECGWTCLNDDPTTDNIDVPEVVDDGREEDDTAGTAKPLGLGLIGWEIARDQDWQSFELVSLSHVTFDALHDPLVGRLDLLLLDAAGGQVAIGLDQADRTQVVANFLQAGAYKLRISPRDSADFNFYDMKLTLETVPVECSADQVGEEACGNCGTRVRLCTALGQWGDFGACTAEGVCVPGSQSDEACGLCGTMTRNCSEACAWIDGACAGEGICTPEAVDSQDCIGAGKKERVCGADCAWGDFGDCTGGECAPDDIEGCYSGPPATKDVGACHGGTHTCSNGAWTICKQEKLPGAEICDGVDDEDCDGFDDDEDPDCDMGAGVGEACASDTDCAEDLDCAVAPDFPHFVGGLCTLFDCASKGGCDEGVCALFYVDELCLATCGNDADCRGGFQCTELEPQGPKVCVPRCFADTDCPYAAFDECDTASGLCVPAAVPEPGPEPVVEVVEEISAPDTAPVDTATGTDASAPPKDGSATGDTTGTPDGFTITPGPDTSDESATSSGSGGCSLSPASRGSLPSLGLLLLLALAALGLRRRARA